jgi:hypothetical protein
MPDPTDHVVTDDQPNGLQVYSRLWVGIAAAVLLTGLVTVLVIHRDLAAIATAIAEHSCQ